MLLIPHIGHFSTTIGTQHTTTRTASSITTPQHATTTSPSGLPCTQDEENRVDSLYTHVYDSGRLEVHAKCITITGTVEDDPRHEPDGDTHFILTLDPAYVHLSRDNNCKPATHGCNLLIVEVICHNPIDKISYPKAEEKCGTYKSPVTDPKYGEHVSVTGRYVLDTDHGSRGKDSSCL